MVMFSGALKTVAAKSCSQEHQNIANRTCACFGSGPSLPGRSGLRGELILGRQNEPGSQHHERPGKVQPQTAKARGKKPEPWSAAHCLMGNDAAVGFARSQGGTFEAETCINPMMFTLQCVLQSMASLLGPRCGQPALTDLMMVVWTRGTP